MNVYSILQGIRLVALPFYLIITMLLLQKYHSW